MNSSLRHEFELNCLLTRSDSNLSTIQFKELRLLQRPNYRELRKVLHEIESIWYAEGSSIYLLGDTREIRSTLSENDIESGLVQLVSYKEMLVERESILKYLLYSAITKLMYKQGFLPTISRSQHAYYPQFNSKSGVRTTLILDRSRFRAVAKRGLVFDIDLSPDGPALLWFDTKLITFLHVRKHNFKSGRPVYILCPKMEECSRKICIPLLEGGFIAESEDPDSMISSCDDADSFSTVKIRSKSRRIVVAVPHEYIYVRPDPHRIKKLKIYDWWRPIAIPPSHDRYDMMWQLMKLIAQNENSLSIPLPYGEKLAFDMTPITQNVQVRFAK